ncbi:phospholipase A and acyltransferase 2-like [Amphiura filiformis]|uniref:phospholipase A and acyltransferase 2-like n=1 Tax=Amphiura filiformis TaxID=82378 RepID=UPI003B226AA3
MPPHFGLKTEWAHPDRVRPIAGDKLEFKRSVYNHLGIADGKGGIYHFSPGKGSGKGSEVALKSDKSRIYWRHDKLTDVADGDLMRINNSLDHRNRPYDMDEIIRRCESSLGYFGNTYTIHSNNCEHKTNEMRYGLSTSQQVETVGKSALIAGGILVGGAIAIAGMIDAFADEE